MFDSFPIDFDLLVHSKTEKNTIELLTPSLVHTKKLEPEGHLAFEIDISMWKKNALIVFTSHFIDIKAEIKKNFDDT